MTDFVFPVPVPTTLAVAGSTSVFPVGRVYCIGRNYKWSDNESTSQDMPAWFMKPANAIVSAQGILPYPAATRDFCHEIELVVAIGKGGREIDPAQVEQHHIWGYAAGLDLHGAIYSSKLSAPVARGSHPKPSITLPLVHPWCLLRLAATQNMGRCG